MYALPSERVVHLWHSTLELDSASTGHLSAFLAPDEFNRASQFRLLSDCRNYTVAHGILRLILGRYLQISPRTIKFQRGQFGKPYLAGKINPQQLEFNMSHAGGYLLIGITTGYAIGVDIELMRADIEVDQIAGSLFSSAEMQFVNSCNADQKLDTFYSCWTAKEAVLKAAGTGLTRDPTELSVMSSCRLDRQQVRLEVFHSPGYQTYFVRNLPVISGYRGALATALAPSSIEHRHFDFSSMMLSDMG